MTKQSKNRTTMTTQLDCGDTLDGLLSAYDKLPKLLKQWFADNPARESAYIESNAGNIYSVTRKDYRRLIARHKKLDIEAFHRKPTTEVLYVVDAKGKRDTTYWIRIANLDSVDEAREVAKCSRSRHVQTRIIKQTTTREVVE